MRSRTGRRSALALTGLLAAALVPLSPLATTAATAATPGTAPASAAGEPRHLHSWWYDAMHLAAAQRETTGKGVTVAVIDYAIDPSAADIAGTDLTMAKDCSGRTTKPAGAKIGDHGSAMVTNLAGTGKGNAAGGLGVLGIAPGASVRFYGMDTDPSTKIDDGCVFEDRQSKVFDQAVDDGADIISISMVPSSNDANKKAIRRAIAKGVVVVASSGERTPKNQYEGLYFPAELPGVVSTNAIDRKGAPWSGNPRPLFVGDKREFPTISAPGVEVDSSGYEAGRGWRSGGTRTGTSDAAPIVAGALALVKAKYPDATGNQLVQQLIHYTTSDGKFYWDKDYGFGIVSAKRMLAHDPTKWPDVNPLDQGLRPQQIVAKYPMSLYGKASSSGSGSGSGSDSASDSASASASPASSAQGSDDKTSSGTTDEATQQDQGGMPGWVWVVVVLGAAGVALGATRGRRGRT